MSPSDVSAVLVTRGDVDMTEIFDSLATAGIEDVVVWNNSLEQNLAVYGRYAGIEQARHDVIYVQDDDCVLYPAAIGELVAAYEPGVLVANMPARFRHGFYAEHCLVGFGAVFDRDLPAKAFDGDWGDPQILPLAAFAGVAPDFFNRGCDVVFSTLTPRKLVDVEHRDLPWASAAGRMWTSPGHQQERERMLALALQVRDA